MNQNDEIEKLKRRLYRRGEAFKEREIRSPLTPRPTEARPYWKEPLEEEAGFVPPEKPKSSFKKLFVIAGAVLALAAVAGLIYFFAAGPNVVSSKNIEISAQGPTGIKGGEEGTWQVIITNKNRANLELADFIIEYPAYSMPVSANINTARPLYERRSVGNIASGQTIMQTVQAYLFGAKDSDQVFKLTLEYRPEGSNAILATGQNYTVRLMQSPVEISFTAPKEANAGEPVTLEADIISNSESAIDNLNFKMDYPAGFKYQDADPKPAAADNVWRLGTIEKNKTRIVKITGVLEGQDLTELAFRASAGPLNNQGEVIPYGAGVQTIILKKAFLELGADVGTRAGQDIGQRGETINVDVKWKNTLPVKIYNAVIEVKISGEAVDQKSIYISKGFYRSFDSTLVWNSASSPDLAGIEPAEEGVSNFKFNISDPLSNNVIRKGNPVVSIDVAMTGQKAAEAGAEPGQVQNHFSKEIKIATELQLSRRGLYYSGPFKNSGPLPPKVGKETSYTIIWALTNSSSDVSEAAVNAFLPPYVRWLGAINPAAADVSYNQSTGEVLWRPGAVPAGTGILQPAKELAFQISFLPNASQIGSQPTLVSEATLGGKDTFTGALLRDAKSALTTYLDTDPELKYNESAVAQ